MSQQTLILFKQESLGDVFLWNGDYPIHVHPRPDGAAWHPQGELSEKEAQLFKELETSKKRTFELKDRGRFNILQRIKLPEDDTRD